MNNFCLLLIQEFKHTYIGVQLDWKDYVSATVLTLFLKIQSILLRSMTLLKMI